MATVNLLTYPERLSPSHYPNVYTFEEVSIGSPGFATDTITFTGPITSGQFFSFYVADTTGSNNNIFIGARDNPSNGDIPTTAAGYTDNEITIAIVNELNNNPAFNYAYIAEYAITGIFQITALKQGTKWNASYSYVLGATTSGLVQLGGGTNEFASDGYDTFSVYLDVVLPPSNTYIYFTSNPGTKIARFVRSKNDENEYYFDISDMIKSFVNDKSELLLRQTNFKQLTETTRNYNVFYGWSYTSGNTFNFSQQESTIQNQWVINSSLPYDIQNDSYLEYQALTGRTFLTNQPARKVVDIQESSPLCYFHYQDILGPYTVAASTELTFTNGDVLTAITGNYFDTVVPNDGIWYADIGPANLPIAGLENLYQREIASYDVWIRRKVIGTYTDELTERRTFVIDRTCKDNKKFIYWKNELGGIDSWTFHGKTNQSTDIEQSLFSKFELNNGNKFVPSRNTGKISKTTKINCSTGWIDEDHYNWMRDSLVGSPVIWINETGNVTEKIIIVDLTVQKDSDNLMYNILITFEKSVVLNHIGK